MTSSFSSLLNVSIRNPNYKGVTPPITLFENNKHNKEQRLLEEEKRLSSTREKNIIMDFAVKHNRFCGIL